MIQVGDDGAVLNGAHPDMNVQVEDDTANSGGFLIYKWWRGSGGLGPDGVFDDWVESREALEEYWREIGWQVDWTPREP